MSQNTGAPPERVYGMIQKFAASDYAAGIAGARPPRLLSASKIDASTTIHPRVLHKHDNFCELLFVRTGSGSYIVEETRYPIRQGDLVLCNAGILHDEDPARSVDLNMLSIAMTDLHVKGLPLNHFVDADTVPVFPAGVFADMVDFLMISIFDLLAEDPVDSVETCNYLTAGLVSSILMILSRRCTQENPVGVSKSNLIAERVKAYINAHYSEDLTLQDISDALHISIYYLAHVFKQQTGYSPKQYMLRRRLGEAQTLLISTDLSITSISLAVGYGNPNHFDRMFSKYIGMSPSNYRSFYLAGASGLP